MTLHIDVVRNEWDQGYQALVAQAFPVEHDVKVTMIEGTDWEEILRQPVVDRVSGENVRPDEPERFLKVLSDVFDGTVFFATPPHEDNPDQCPFHGKARQRLPLRRVRGSKTA